MQIPGTDMSVEGLLHLSMNIGERMLCCGAEINRVEDSLRRIAFAYGMKRVNVFCLANFLAETVRTDTEDSFTETRRVVTYQTNLNRLARLNQLCREICAELPNEDVIRAKLSEIDQSPVRSLRTRCLFSAVMAAAFTAFFGGGADDCLISAGIGVLIRLLMNLMWMLQANSVFSNMCTSAIAGGVAALLFQFGLGSDLDAIIIGNVMLLIPGLVLMNAIRDAFNGDILTGIFRLAESITLAVSIAAGFVLAVNLVTALF